MGDKNNNREGRKIDKSSLISFNQSRHENLFRMQHTLQLNAILLRN